MVLQIITVWLGESSRLSTVQANTITDSVSSTVNLSAVGEAAVSGEPEIAIDNQGNAIAVWTVYKNGYYIVQASTKSLTGTWTTPVDISAAGSTASLPQIAIDSLGNAIAVWSSSNGTDNINQASTKTFNGTWTKPVNLSAVEKYTYNHSYPRIAIDSRGNAIAVWNMFNNIIQASTKTLTGTWTTPVDISASGQIPSPPQIAIDRLGNAIAVWQIYNGADNIIQASTKTLIGTWTTPVNLSTAGQSADPPQIAIDSLGNAIAVWTRYGRTGDKSIVQASTKTLTGNWTTPVNLSAAGGDDSNPQVAMDSLGNAIAVWLRYNGTNNIIQASTKTLTSTWTTPVDLSAAGQFTLLPKVAMDSLGNAIAVWNRVGLTGDKSIVQASTKTLTGTWTTPVDLSTAAQNAANPAVVIYEYTTTTTTTEPICLVAGTPIVTDQGVVPIEKIDTNKHTIANKRIVAVTKTITPEKQLIVFEENSIAINCPSQRTIMTPGHEVLYKGKLVQSKHFVGRLDGVHTMPYNGKDILYNVLLEKHGLMRVNNMVLETLHPENKVAKKILEKH